MPDTLAPLEELPQTTREFVTSTIASGIRLLSQSAALFKPDQSAISGLFALRSAILNLHFFVARDGEEVIFFFFKKERPTVTPLQAELTATVQAVAQTAPSAPPSASAAPTPVTSAAASVPCSYRLLVPPFLVARPSAQDLADYAPPGTTADNGILLRLGADGSHVLGVRDPAAGKNATAVFTTLSRQPLDGWSAEPFLELIETLRQWLSADDGRGQELDLLLPSDPGSMTDVHVTLYSFVAAYLSMEAEAQRAQAQPLPPPLPFFVPSYAVQDYTAEISLCVDESGRFATTDQGELVSLGLRMTVSRETANLVARITLHPPDFLFSGSLHQVFLAQLRGSMPGSVLKSINMPTADQFNDFLDSAADRTVVFRTEHDGDSDVDIVVLPGTFGGNPRTLILRTIAVVDTKANPPSVKLSGITLSYDSKLSGKQLLDDKTVTYFMRLLTALKDWLTVLR